MAEKPFAAVRIDTSKKRARNLVTIFEIDDVEYQIEDPIPKRYAVAFLRDAAHMDQVAAAARTIEAVLGEKALAALAECDEVTDEQIDTIMSALNARLMAVTKAVLKN
jgi:hypothetical protein